VPLTLRIISRNSSPKNYFLFFLKNTTNVYCICKNKERGLGVF
jgi:hypothetical protein